VTRRAEPTLGLLVLAKAPEPGRVKTRLCPPLTSEEAADLAAAALLDTLAAVGAVPGGRTVVALTGRPAVAARASQLATALDGVTMLDQRGPDLGHRIAAAHRDAADLLPGRPVLQLGMDTPQVESALLVEAAGPLRRGTVEAVLGPATDGGWWALGLRDPRAAAAVADVPTSRDDTGERTLHALRAAGLRVGLLPELTDVDTMADAVAVRRVAPWSRFAAALAALAALPPAGESLRSGVRTTEVVRANGHRTGAA
jgi:rSAM/selenodomain-associated transferase 1